MMRPYRSARSNKSGLLVLLAAIAALGLLVEGTAALVLSREDASVGELGSQVTGAPAAAEAAPMRQAAGPSTFSLEQAPRTSLQPRPRLRLQLPRIALWPAPPPAVPTGETAARAPSEGAVSIAFIDGYLERKNSPMMGMGREFWERGRQYNVDPRLLVAISGNETGFGHILTSQYNAFNWFYRGMWDSDFRSWAEAIEVVTRGIRQHYFDEGRTTLATLGEKYGPIGAANDPQNLNVNFVPNVTFFLREMGGNPEHLTFD